MRTLLALALPVAFLVGCGDREGADTKPVERPLVGTYVLDVERTSPAGEAAEDDPSRGARLAAKFGMESYRLEILANGTFHTTVQAGPDTFVLSGTWVRDGSSLQLTTTAVNGEPAPPGMGNVETGTLEPGRILLYDSGHKIVLRRL